MCGNEHVLSSCVYDSRFESESSLFDQTAVFLKLFLKRESLQNAQYFQIFMLKLPKYLVNVLSSNAGMLLTYFMMILMILLSLVLTEK